MTTLLPDAPWVRIAADIFKVDKRKYLVVVNYFSRFIDRAYLPDMSGKTVTLRLSNMFARWVVLIPLLLTMVHNWRSTVSGFCKRLQVS